MVTVPNRCSPRCGNFAIDIAPSDQPVRPQSAAEIGMVLGGRWYRLTLRPERS